MINLNDIYLYIFLLTGLIFGSFLNVIIYRLPRELSFSKGRSCCTHCNHKLHWYDLFPLFSYLSLLGKCRYCKEKISIQYPLVESITSLSFGLVYTYVTNNFGEFKYYHTILLVIVALVIVGVFTDFLYHGTFDFSTTLVCILYFIFLIFKHKSLIVPIKSFIMSLSFFLPIIFILFYVNFKTKKKWLLAGLSLVLVLIASMYGILRFQIDVNATILVLNSIMKWVPISILIIFADYIIKKCTKSATKRNIVENILNYANFIIFSLFLLNLRIDTLSPISYKDVFVLNFKNLIIVTVGTMLYLFFIEMFNNHDNNEDLIDENDEIIDREDNVFSQYIGDGDLLILPFVGMVLGVSNLFNFFSILGFSVLSVYIFIFRKGFKYSIPLYPYIALSTLILM